MSRPSGCSIPTYGHLLRSALLGVLALVNSERAVAFVQLTQGGNCTVSTSVDNLTGVYLTETCNRGSGDIVTPPFTFSDGRDFGNVSATYGASGGFGSLTLHAAAQASAAITPDNNGFLQLFGEADSNVMGYDTITLGTHGAVANGTMVPLTITMRLHGSSNTSTSPQGTTAQDTTDFTVGFGDDPSVGTTSEAFDAGDGDAPFDQTIQFIVTAAIGVEVEFSQSFGLTAAIDAAIGPDCGCTPPASISTDFIGTAELFFSSADPDTIMTFGSGHDYALPRVATVDEPDVSPLFTVGALAFWRLRSRKTPSERTKKRSRA